MTLRTPSLILGVSPWIYLMLHSKKISPKKYGGAWAMKLGALFRSGKDVSLGEAR